MKKLTPIGNKVPPMKLTDVQRYLIGRIPGVWSLSHTDIPEPDAVKKARLLITKFDAKCADTHKKHDAEWKAARREVTDSVYFDAPKVAKAKLDALYKRFRLKDGL